MNLSDIQTALVKSNLDAFIVTRNNMFIGQDILAEENQLLNLTGFSGSAGSLMIFRDKIYLFVDGRYELQASQEVDTSRITVVVTSDSLGSWMQNNLKEPCKIAYDSWCHSISEVDYWNRALKRHTFVEADKTLAGTRLSAKEAEIFEHGIEFSGISMDEKISYLTTFMQENQIDAYFISECDAVSWLLNLRSDCLPNTPIIRAFALVDKLGEVSLFTNNFQKIEEELGRFQGKNIGVSYNTTPKHIQTLMKSQRIWMVNLPNPIQNWKAVKNPVELSGFKNAHRRDALAMVKFLHWLENNWNGQDELSVVAKLHEFRATGEHFYGNSFETIAGFGSNGAIVHYQPHEKTNQKLLGDSVLLLDSGAQYFDGTTDITRTIAIGAPNSEIVDSFTQVLKAHIAVVEAFFPSGAMGNSLDALARAQLWRYGKEYKHGTGHGVGCFLNVHEGPQSLSIRGTSSGLLAGMISSIEPGYYKSGAYGIRIENLAYVEAVNNADFETPMLKFVPLTLVPIDKRLINKYLLNEQETAWLNNYHHLVWNELQSHLEAETKDWLKQACAPL